MAKTEMLAARVEPEFLELLNKIVLLSQLEQTPRSYKDTSTFIMAAVTRQMREEFTELSKSESIRPLMRDLLRGFDISALLGLTPEQVNLNSNSK